MTVVTNSFQRRRLAKLLIMLSQRACDEQDFEIASNILRLAETFMLRSMISSTEKRPIITLLVAGHELLWTRRHRGLALVQTGAADPF